MAFGGAARASGPFDRDRTGSAESFTWFGKFFDAGGVTEQVCAVR
jgi:hypothetical protein